METISYGKWRGGPLDYPRRYLTKFAGFKIIVTRYQFPSVSILKARNKIGVKMRRRIINIEDGSVSLTSVGDLERCIT